MTQLENSGICGESTARENWLHSANKNAAINKRTNEISRSGKAVSKAWVYTYDATGQGIAISNPN